MGLMIGAYSPYQIELSDKIIRLRDTLGLTYKAIAEVLISEGYRSPRGFDLGPESVYSIYKKRKRRDERLLSALAIKIMSVEIEYLT